MIHSIYEYPNINVDVENDKYQFAGLFSDHALSLWYMLMSMINRFGG